MVEGEGLSHEAINGEQVQVELQIKLVEEGGKYWRPCGGGSLDPIIFWLARGMRGKAAGEAQPKCPGLETNVRTVNMLEVAHSTDALSVAQNNLGERRHLPRVYGEPPRPCGATSLLARQILPGPCLAVQVNAGTC